MEFSYWQWYQSRIADLFSRVEGAIVESDVKEVGKRSGIERQLDIRISLPINIDLGEGFSISIPIKIIVDSKAHNVSLDIKEIEEIIGLKEDIQANLAIVVSPKGVSAGAMERAKADGVFPITVTGDLLGLMHRLELPLQRCKFCEEGCVSWRNELEGYCDYCNELHVRCPDCYEVIGIPDTQLDIGVQCGAQCGTIFLVTYKSKGMDYDIDVYDTLNSMLLTKSYHKPNKRLTTSEVSRIVEKTKWQHWGEGSPTLYLTEFDLMRWGDDDCLYLTDEGERIVTEIVLEAEPAFFY